MPLRASTLLHRPVCICFVVFVVFSRRILAHEGKYCPFKYMTGGDIILYRLQFMAGALMTKQNNLNNLLYLYRQMLMFFSFPFYTLVECTQTSL